MLMMLSRQAEALHLGINRDPIRAETPCKLLFLMQLLIYCAHCTHASSSNVTGLT